MNRSDIQQPPSWSIIDGWARPTDASPDWGSLSSWTALLDAIGAESRAKLLQLRTQWDEDLAELGGDPSSVDWSSFRPLRREREEDWSDWLAQLIEDSVHLGFAWRMFGPSEGHARSAYRVRRLRRELAVEDRRADLVIEWTDDRYTHVEVKVGDPHLDCVFRTHLGTRSGVTWAPVPDDLGTDSGTLGRPFRHTWAAVPAHLGVG